MIDFSRIFPEFSHFFCRLLLKRKLASKKLSQYQVVIDFYNNLLGDKASSVSIGLTGKSSKL